MASILRKGLRGSTRILKTPVRAVKAFTVTMEFAEAGRISPPAQAGDFSAVEAPRGVTVHPGEPRELRATLNVRF